MGYSFSSEAIDNYFIFLSKSDAGNKKKFIMKLTESIESENTNAFNPRSLIGAWENLEILMTSLKKSMSQELIHLK